MTAMTEPSTGEAAAARLVAERGLARALLAVLRAALARRQRRRRYHPDRLNGHMRRDIGLPALPPERPRIGGGLF